VARLVFFFFVPHMIPHPNVVLSAMTVAFQSRTNRAPRLKEK
jgi:hypothetical protein